jgi:hypothetical protein
VRAERFFDYTFEITDLEIKGEYMLRGDVGTYREVWYGGEPLNGTLTHLSDDPVDIEGIGTVNGFRYSGTDETGDYLYFFGSDDITGAGGFLIAIFDDFSNPNPGWVIGSRTDA